jgi:hypothetical protein
MPILESFGDREHLMISDLIIALGFIKERRSEGDQMPEGVYIIALLQNYSTDGVS